MWFFFCFFFFLVSTTWTCTAVRALHLFAIAVFFTFSVFCWEECELANTEKWQTELMLPSLYRVNIWAPCEVILSWLCFKSWLCMHVYIYTCGWESEASLYLFVVSAVYHIKALRGRRLLVFLTTPCLVTTYKSVLAKWSFKSDIWCLINDWKTTWVCSGQPLSGLF